MQALYTEFRTQRNVYVDFNNKFETASSVLCLFHESLLKQSYNLSRYISWNSNSTGA